MKIGNTIINGFFEYKDDLEFTESDLVIRTYVNSDNINIRRIFYVKSNVIGVQPELDLSETYYEDYFKRVYGNENILTKSNVLTYLGNMFSGLTELGTFNPTLITQDERDQINRSGVWKLADGSGTVLVYVCQTESFMITTDKTKIFIRFGSNNSDGTVSWGLDTLVSGNASEIVSNQIAELNALRKLLKDTISKYNDLIEAFAPEFSNEFINFE